jgi:hypothetical protein
MKEFYLSQARAKLNNLKAHGFMNLQHNIGDYHKQLMSFGLSRNEADEICFALMQEFAPDKIMVKA